MRLLVIGDYTLDDPTAVDAVNKTLDHLFKEYDTEFVLSFDEKGVDDVAITWAFDNELPFDMFEIKKMEEYKKEGDYHVCYPNRFLRSVVDSFQIDAFLFFFLENMPNQEQDKSPHRKLIRNFYKRATNHFKKQIVFTTHQVPPT
jgi:hypothetical protein